MVCWVVGVVANEVAEVDRAEYWFSVAWGGNTFVAVSRDGTNQVMTSTDGITWTARSAPTGSNWWSETYGAGLFVAVARNCLKLKFGFMNWKGVPSSSAGPGARAHAPRLVAPHDWGGGGL